MVGAPSGGNSPSLHLPAPLKERTISGGGNLGIGHWEAKVLRWCAYTLAPRSTCSPSLPAPGPIVGKCSAYVSELAFGSKEGGWALCRAAYACRKVLSSSMTEVAALPLLLLLLATAVLADERPETIVGSDAATEPVVLRAISRRSSTSKLMKCLFLLLLLVLAAVGTPLISTNG